jgi:hypothetical protein
MIRLRHPGGKELRALSMGSGSMTMPGPPPYGRSSTLLCLSRAKSLGFMNSNRKSPCSQALNMSPQDRGEEKNSGKMETIFIEMGISWLQKLNPPRRLKQAA